MVVNGSGTNGYGGRSLTGLFQKVSSQAITGTTDVSKVAPAQVGSAFDSFHNVDGFFSAKEGIGRRLAQVADNSVPVSNALPTLSKYLSGSTRLTDLSA